MRAYAPPEPGLAADLDLFGHGSLFQLLSAARLHAGEQTLATGDCGLESPATIDTRQSAVVDLRDRVDIRERLALTSNRQRLGVAATHSGLVRRWVLNRPC